MKPGNTAKDHVFLRTRLLKKAMKQTNTLPKPLFNRVAIMLRKPIQEPDPCPDLHCKERGSGKTCLITFTLPHKEHYGHHWKLVTCKEEHGKGNKEGQRLLGGTTEQEWEYTSFKTDKKGNIVGEA